MRIDRRTRRCPGIEDCSARRRRAADWVICGNRGSGVLQVAQQRRYAIVVGAGGLGHGREVGKDRRNAVLTASLEKRYQVGHKVNPAVSGRYALRVSGGPAGGRAAGDVGGFGVTAVAWAAATTLA